MPNYVALGGAHVHVNLERLVSPPRLVAQAVPQLLFDSFVSIATILLASEKIRGGDDSATLKNPKAACESCALNLVVRPFATWRVALMLSTTVALVEYKQYMLVLRSGQQIVRGGVQVRGSATYFSRPTPSHFANGSVPARGVHMILAAVKLYSLPQYLLVAIGRKAEHLAILCSHRG